MSVSPRPPFVDYDWDDELGLEDLPEAKFVTQEGIYLADRWLVADGRFRVLTLEIFVFLHRILFEGVFPQFAGRLRGHGDEEIAREVSFGYYYGTRAADVPTECHELFRIIGGNIARLDEMQRTWPPEEFAEQVRMLAAYTHCELIRIHPFVNGNGRAARKCIDYFTWRYGFLPVDFPPKEDASGRSEYRDAVRSYLQHRRYDHFADYLQPTWEADPAVEKAMQLSEE